MVGVTSYQCQYLHVVSLVVIFARGEVLKWNDVNPQSTTLQTWLTRDEKSMAPLLCDEGDAWMNHLPKTGPPRNDEVMQTRLTRDEMSMAPFLRAKGDAWMNPLSQAGPPRNDEVKAALHGNEGELPGSEANAWCTTRKRTAHVCAVDHAGGRSRDLEAGCKLWVAWFSRILTRVRVGDS